ncbi:MAG: Addiction module toxin, RelE/StbE family [Candidatus Amesbacteria bacterium GW2011_GWA2_42_12]|uniref:Addiction module toxin, RelE/StbE family n=1 Tax=Candidatus Amesbacteria bacterium GW2011_GWA2_42_12 TaxID=1618356 RepID=A0A0G0Y5Z1_9BACT|nr:MAG: Addiction module toxin, RelE/StbE family [Candidatus Amesbacteria bacterium GW2011_GWA2_42_12]
MSWIWEFTKESEKQFKKLDNQTKKRVLEKLDFWVSSGSPLEFAENLHDFELGSYRFRIGDYRVTFDVEDKTIVVLAVGHRREIYK